MYYNFFYQGNTPGGSKITNKITKFVRYSEPILWPVVINKTIMQQNWIKTLHHNGNPLE